MNDMNNMVDAKNHNLKRYYLWQKKHYTYQITGGQDKSTGAFKVYKDLTNMTCQQAKDEFIKFRP